jgi:hypothetical protein
MSVENAESPSNPVPSGTECDNLHIAYLTARGRLVAVHFSTNILSPPGQKNATPLSRPNNMSAETFPATLMLRAVRYGISVENAESPSNPVPSGTECDNLHIAYLTARGRLIAVNVSTNILSPPGQIVYFILLITIVYYLLYVTYCMCEAPSLLCIYRHCEERSNPGAGGTGRAAVGSSPAPGLLRSSQ